VVLAPLFVEKVTQTATFMVGPLFELDGARAPKAGSKSPLKTSKTCS
jgi:hypothetical protein